MTLDPVSARTILIIEDDSVTREGLATILSREGYDVVPARDGLEAIRLLNSGFTPSLILLDMILPALDGWGFFIQRRLDARLKAIPVMVMTGLGIASDEWATSIGAVALFRKPLDVKSLLNAIHQHCAAEAPARSQRDQPAPG